MDWIQVLTIVGANIALILSMLSTVVSIWMNMDKKFEQNRKETNEILKGIAQEMKDFHGRLCAIEERNKKQ